MKRWLFNKKTRVNDDLELAQVPDEQAAVVATGQDKRLRPIPMDDVDVVLVCVGRCQHAGSTRVHPSVPDPNAERKIAIK